MPEPVVTAAGAGAGRLGLGTVQFGLDYGVTNATGQVEQDEANAILKAARALGIGLLDTAALYGESESVLGRSPELGAFAIVTKTPKLTGARSGSDARTTIESGLASSLSKLGTDRVYGLLVHDASDLRGELGQAVWDCLLEARDRGAVQKVGVSVYDGEQIEAVLERFQPDIVQLPINALDHRLLDSGILDALGASGIEVHARSIFLQGLLLTDPERLPDRFTSLRPVLTDLNRAYSAEGLSAIEGLLASVFRHGAIGKVIVGTTNRGELEQIAKAAEAVAARHVNVDFGRYRIDDNRILNPGLWTTL